MEVSCPPLTREHGPQALKVVSGQPLNPVGGGGGSSHIELRGNVGDERGEGGFNMGR